MGDHIQECVRNTNSSQKSRHLLVGGMCAKKIILATPLLKWNLEHGMLVTHIYQVVEFSRQKCFESFAKDVSEARRRGDDNNDLQALNILIKL